MGAVMLVAGISHYQSAAVLCAVGDDVVLRANPSNPHDRNAIQVWVRGRMVGHVPRDIAARIAQMESPAEFSGRVVERLGSGICVGLRIELSFDIRSSPPKMRAARHTWVGVQMRPNQLRALVREFLGDRDYFPADPEQGYEVMESLRSVQSALDEGFDAKISAALEGVRVRYATRRGIHAWRMSLLAAWWRLDADESQRLAALLVAYVADAPTCLAMNGLVADVRLSVPEESRARLDSDATALRALDRAAVDDAGMFDLGRGLLRPDSPVRCVAEAAGVAAAIAGDSARFVRLLSEVTEACTGPDRKTLDRSGLSRSFAERIAAALTVLPPDALLTPDEREQLDRFALPSAWRAGSWGDGDARGRLLLRLAGELGDAEADFLSAMRMEPNAGGTLDPLVESLLRRALQRGDPSMCALMALASIATRAGGANNDPVLATASWFFEVCGRAGRQQYSLVLRIAAPAVGDRDEPIRRLDQLASRPGASMWTLLCRDIALLTHAPRRVDRMAFVHRVETAAVDHPELGWILASFTASGDPLLHEWFPDLRERSVQILRMSVRRGHIQSAKELVSLLRSQPDCAAPSEVATLLELLASRGGAADAATLAWQFANGDGVPKDETKATEWFGKAATAGDADSQCSYGFRLGQGIGITMDRVAAVDWYRKSAEAGNAIASYNMGCVYEAGLGVPKDEAEAFKWFLRAANAGYANAMHVVARRLHAGQGIQCDHEQAVEWAERLRATGDARGSVLLGKAYTSGQGVPADMEKARALLEEGTQRGSTDAAAALGALYFRLGEAESDAARAFDCWLAAAKLEHPAAMLKVADCYREGRGAEQSEELWRTWAERALHAGRGEVAVAIARACISKGTAESELQAAEALLIGLRQGDNSAEMWLIELLQWSEIPIKPSVEMLAEVLQRRTDHGQALAASAVLDILLPFGRFHARSMHGSPKWRSIDVRARDLDPLELCRRAASIVIALSRRPTAGLTSPHVQLVDDFLESELIARGEVEDAWQLQSALNPSASRSVWEKSRAIWFSSASFRLLASDGEAGLSKATAWLRIAVLDDPKGIARYNLAVALIVGSGGLGEEVRRLIEGASLVGLKEAKDVDGLLREADEASRASIATVGFTTLTVLLVCGIGLAAGWVNMAVPALFPLVLFFVLLFAPSGFYTFVRLSLIARKFGSVDVVKLDALTVSTHVGIFCAPRPPGYSPLGDAAFTENALTHGNEASQCGRFRHIRRYMVEPRP